MLGVDWALVRQMVDSRTTKQPSIQPEPSIRARWARLERNWVNDDAAMTLDAIESDLLDVSDMTAFLGSSTGRAWLDWLDTRTACAARRVLAVRYCGVGGRTSDDPNIRLAFGLRLLPWRRTPTRSRRDWLTWALADADVHLPRLTQVGDDVSAEAMLLAATVARRRVVVARTRDQGRHAPVFFRDWCLANAIVAPSLHVASRRIMDLAAILRRDRVLGDDELFRVLRAILPLNRWPAGTRERARHLPIAPEARTGPTMNVALRRPKEQRRGPSTPRAEFGYFVLDMDSRVHAVRLLETALASKAVAVRLPDLGSNAALDTWAFIARRHDPARLRAAVKQLSAMSPEPPGSARLLAWSLAASFGTKAYSRASSAESRRSPTRAVSRLGALSFAIADALTARIVRGIRRTSQLGLVAVDLPEWGSHATVPHVIEVLRATQGRRLPRFLLHGLAGAVAQALAAVSISDPCVARVLFDRCLPTTAVVRVGAPGTSELEARVRACSYSDRWSLLVADTVSPLQPPGTTGTATWTGHAASFAATDAHVYVIGCREK